MSDCSIFMSLRSVREFPSYFFTTAETWPKRSLKIELLVLILPVAKLLIPRPNDNDVTGKVRASGTIIAWWPQAMDNVDTHMDKLHEWNFFVFKDSQPPNPTLGLPCILSRCLRGKEGTVHSLFMFFTYGAYLCTQIWHNLSDLVVFLSRCLQPTNYIYASW